MEQLTLEQLQQKLVKLQLAHNKINSLTKQQTDLEEKVNRLKKVKDLEQDDVDKLESKSLSNYLLKLIGKHNEKLSNEKQEAYSALLKYEVAVKELEDVKNSISDYRHDYLQLKDYKNQYETLIKQGEQKLKTGDDQLSKDFLEIQKTLDELYYKRKQLDEAIDAGNKALAIVNSITNYLTDAKSWATFDVVAGGIVSDIAKHSDLNDAQKLIYQLQKELRNFKTEINDVSIDADIKVTVDGFLKFADFFYDGLIADFMVRLQIKQSLIEIETTKTNILNVVNYLKGQRSQTLVEISNTVTKKTSFIKSTLM